MVGLRALLLIPLILLGNQKECKELVYKEAKKWSRFPSTVVAIAMTESSCGIHLIGDDGNSLGIMQMQVATVKYIASKDKSIQWVGRLSDKVVRTLLVRNDKLSVEIATKLFEFSRRRYGYFQAISRYNGGKRNTTYYNKVMKNKEALNAKR